MVRWVRAVSAVPPWVRRAPDWVDVVLGLLAAALALAAIRTTDPASVDPRLHDPTVWAELVTVAGAGALVWRRRHPMRCFVIVCTAAVAVSAGGYYIGQLGLLLAVALLSLAVHCRRRRDAVVALLVTLAVLVLLALARVPDLRPSDFGRNVVLYIAAWAVGDALRSRRAYQAERLRVAEWEAEAARQDAARAGTEERLRLARELHDVVAHSMSLIAIQAGVGAHVLDSDPAAAGRALEVIADTSRSALTQTRSLLAVLRDKDAAPDRSPAPGLGDLDDLVQRVRQSGLAVDLAVTGEPRPVGAPIGLAAYRIVQESLTNVLKHARAEHVRVGLAYEPACLRIEVADDGRPAAPAAGTGHGLAGLRERAALLGGSCAGAPGPAGGFTVRAELPA